MNFIDLHIHSTASDGTVSPAAIVDEVHPEKYEKVVLALTDHDCLSGIEEIRESARRYDNVSIIPGVELSTEYNNHSIHILGYNIDINDAKLNKALYVLRNGRDLRNLKILEKLDKLGIHIPAEALQADEGHAIGRPLIANHIVKAGYASSVKEAFDRYLKEGASCYVKRIHFEPEETIRMILKAGGTPVLAHPMQYKSLSRQDLEVFLEHLVDAGLKGIETYYTEFSDEETSYIESLADRFHLLKTGGSDYHGNNKPTYRLGFGWGNLDATFNKIDYTELLTRQDIVN